MPKEIGLQELPEQTVGDLLVYCLVFSDKRLPDSQMTNRPQFSAQKLGNIEDGLSLSINPVPVDEHLRFPQYLSPTSLQ